METRLYRYLALACLLSPGLYACGPEAHDDTSHEAGNGGAGHEVGGETPGFEVFRSRLRAVQAEHAIPGLAVAVVFEGQTFLFAEGVASTLSNEPVTVDTAFNLASLTKPLTAALVMRLADSGQLALDADIAAIAPSVATRSSNGDDVTIGQLLSHSSGLGYPEYLFDGAARVDLSEVADRRTARALVFAEYPLGQWAAPGLIWNYNNQGYSLLGHLAEEAADTPFERVMTEQVFEPLGMTQTGWQADVNVLEPERRLTAGHSGGHVIPPERWSVVGVGHGGVYAPITDMSRFAAAVLERPESFLSASRWEQWLEHRSIGTEGEAYPGSAYWGYGWSHQDVEGVAFLGHSGGFVGAGTHLWAAPERDFAVVAMLNCDCVSPYDITRLAAEHFLGLMPATAPPRSDEWKRYEGAYLAPDTLGSFTVRVEGTSLRVHFEAWDHETELIAYAGRTYGFEMSADMALAVSGDASFRAAAASFFPSEDGKVYFVSRFGVGGPVVE